jgi:hypothetical protein
VAKADPAAVRACYRAAECWLARGDQDQAIKTCAVSLTRHAGIAELACLAAVAFGRTNRLHQAIVWTSISVALGRFGGVAGKFSA